MPLEKNPIKPEYLDAIRRFRLIDDPFMQKVFEDRECCELLLRIVLDRNDLTVKSSRTQMDMKNLQGRSVRLDIFAVDKEGKQYNIEVQRDDSGAVPERARYHSSMMDANLLAPGASFSELPETYVIFITENDVLGYGKPLYTINRTVEEAGHVRFRDRAHIVFVNGAIRNGTKLGKLMQDFFCAEPEKMNYKTLATRADYFKNTAKGDKGMCQIMQELIDRENAKVTANVTASVKTAEKNNFALKLLRKNMPLSEIAELTELTVAEIQALATKTES